jgi:hypothetical protein
MRTVVFLWLMLLTLSGSALVLYGTSPCEGAKAPAHWPSESTLERDRRRPSLVMFLHPQCPCSRASLAELARVRARCPGEMNLQIVVARPAGVPQDWEESSLVAMARAEKGATVSIDEGLAETRRFGAMTSGQVLLYGQDGRLLFAGGITASRGHEGDNAGADALVRALAASGSLQAAPVYGCELCGR